MGTDGKQVSKKGSISSTLNTKRAVGQAGGQGQQPKKRLCFIDTEFNAIDHYGQNRNIQEVTEIGAAIMEGGKIIDRFSAYCKICGKDGVSQRCQEITGMTNEKLAAEGIPFQKAMDDLAAFMKRYGVTSMYAFGEADRNALMASAKLNRLDAGMQGLIRGCRDVYPQFQQALKLPYTYSLTDICTICKAPLKEAHSALGDAEGLALAYYNLSRRIVDRDALLEITSRKDEVGAYRMARNTPCGNMPLHDEADDEFIKKLEKIFKDLDGKVQRPLLYAVHDDFVCLIGRDDLEYGTAPLKEKEVDAA